jgi:hypothetical protein
VLLYFLMIVHTKSEVAEREPKANAVHWIILDSRIIANALTDSKIMTSGQSER